MRVRARASRPSGANRLYPIPAADVELAENVAYTQGPMKQWGWKRKSLAVLVLLLIGYLGYEWITYPDTALLANTNPKTTAWMEMRDKEAREEGKKPRRYQSWKPLRSISPNLKNAVLIAEDAAFFSA